MSIAIIFVMTTALLMSRCDLDNSDFNSRHTVGIAGHDIMYRILVYLFIYQFVYLLIIFLYFHYSSAGVLVGMHSIWDFTGNFVPWIIIGGISIRFIPDIKWKEYCYLIECPTKVVIHYIDVIMSAMASHITSLTIVCSTVYSRRRSKKTSKLCVTGLCAGSNVENISIWWRHHVFWWWKTENEGLIPPSILQNTFSHSELSSLSKIWTMFKSR